MSAAAPVQAQLGITEDLSAEGLVRKVRMPASAVASVSEYSPGEAFMLHLPDAVGEAGHEAPPLTRTLSTRCCMVAAQAIERGEGSSWEGFKESLHQARADEALIQELLQRAHATQQARTPFWA